MTNQNDSTPDRDDFVHMQIGKAGSKVTRANFVDGFINDMSPQQDGTPASKISSAALDLDADLTAFAALAGTGLVAHTAAGTFTERNIAGTANQIGVTNPAGVAGNPTLALLGNALALSGLTGAANKLAYFTGAAAMAVTDLVSQAISFLADPDSQYVNFLQAGTGATTQTVRTNLRYAVWVEQFGAVGDGVADDGQEIQAAINEVSARGGGFVNLGPGTFLSSVKITIPNRVRLHGAGMGVTTIKAANTFNDTALVTNSDHTGGQEYAYIEHLSLDGNKAGGALCTVGVLRLVSLFVDSGIANVLVRNGSAANIKLESANGFGPFFVRDVWALSATTTNFYYEATGTGNASNGLSIINLTAEHQAAGQVSVIFKDTTGSAVSTGFYVKGLHVEQNATGAGTKCVQIDGINGFTLEDLQLLASAPSSHTGVEVTTNVANAGIQIRNVVNSNLIQSIISDLKNSVTYGAVNVPFYSTPDVGINQSISRSLAYGATVNTDCSRGTYNQIVVSDANAFTIASPTNGQVGQSITYEITNISGGPMGVITWGGEFAYRDTWTSPANGKRKTITFVKRSTSAWAEVSQTGDM